MKGKIYVAGRRGRGRKNQLDGLKEKKQYWKLEETTLDFTL
jgi:hypothetical protein